MVALAQNDPENAESIAFIFDYAKDFPERQAHDWEAMETKAVQVLTAASVIIGLASIGSGTTRNPLTVPQAGLLGLGLLAYIGIVACIARVLWTREIVLSRQVDFLWKQRAASVRDLQYRLVEDVIAACEENVIAIHEKSVFVRLAVLLLAIEAATVTVALIWTRLA